MIDENLRSLIANVPYERRALVIDASLKCFTNNTFSSEYISQYANNEDVVREVRQLVLLMEKFFPRDFYTNAIYIKELSALVTYEHHMDAEGLLSKLRSKKLQYA